MSKVSRQNNCHTKAARRTPLYADILRDADISRGLKRTSTVKRHKVDNNDDNDAPETEDPTTIVTGALTSKILRLAAEQQDEIDDHVEEKENTCESSLLEAGAQDPVADPEGFVDFEDEPYVEDAEAFMAQYKPETQGGGGTSLADLILAKLKASESKTGAQREDDFGDIDPKVVKVYQDIGEFLSKYKSGRLPKAFKIIPRLINWEEILYITKPVEWTPNAMHEAVRIFASNLKPRTAQRFYNLVLLPAIREDIQIHKKLNFHYYQALKLAFYKPSAWFQAILFPLLQDECTLREAVIFGSVLGKISIPPLHVAAALVRLSGLHKGNPLHWSISTTYIINILLSKKCALPRTAIDAVVTHFSTFISDSRHLPVLWHQCLLTLAQRYKFDLTQDQKTRIRDLLRVHSHHLITQEIRRELQHAEAMKWTIPAAMEDTQ